MTRRSGLVAAGVIALSALACTSIDPGPQFVVPTTTFDADYFYCHVEPELVVPYKCGPGSASDNNSCHYDSATVTGMVLIDHPAVDCGGGDHPVDPTQITDEARENYQSVSLEMSPDYTTAPVFVRPSGSNHPRAVFSMSDPTVRRILATWASK